VREGLGGEGERVGVEEEDSIKGVEIRGVLGRVEGGGKDMIEESNVSHGDTISHSNSPIDNKDANNIKKVTKILAFIPTGWAASSSFNIKNNTREQNGNVCIYECICRYMYIHTYIDTL
jgi:hypothetical protein